MLGDADPERYAKTLETAAGDPESDGLLVILTPQDMTDPTATAERLAPYANSTRKPVLASWMGGPAVAAGESILNGAGIPTFDYPDTAARATNMWKFTYNLRSIYETPEPAEEESADPAGRRDHSSRPRLWPHHPYRVRGEAGPRRLRYPDGADGGGAQPW